MSKLLFKSLAIVFLVAAIIPSMSLSQTPMAETYMCISKSYLSLPLLVKVYPNKDMIFIDYYNDIYAKMQETFPLNPQSDVAGLLERDFDLHFETIAEMKTSRVLNLNNKEIFHYITSEPSDFKTHLKFILNEANDELYKCQ